MNDTAAGFDFDWLVIGSGFGGSVSALRLAEKGYRVGVLEAGRRYRDQDYAQSAWNLRKFLWLPTLGLRGILRLTIFKDILIASGAGVGGGSVVYANTHYRANDAFFVHPQWQELNDWAAALAPHYATAERMLGTQRVPRDSDAQRLLADVGQHFGVSDTFKRTEVGVYFGAPGLSVADPYFGGSGPERTGCTYCGACMVGCRVGAKNTLVKNYLWFAEKLGAAIFPEREVVDIRPLGAADGSDGYRVTSERPGAWLFKRRQTQRTRGIVMSAGALGSNQLLARCKHGGGLPRISDQLGQQVRTNSESVLALTLPKGTTAKPWNDVAISASIFPRQDTHIELVSYGRHGDFMSTLYTLITGNGSRVTRPLLWLGNVVRHPITFLRSLWPFGWSRRSLLVLVMQSLDNAIAFRARRGLFGRVSLRTEQDPLKPNPTFIAVANEATEWMAQHTGGYAQSMVLEAWANIPTTAHILGGAVIGKDAASGVVDARSQLYGYQNFLVCDGSTLPANPGVNPSLTITAMTEYAMSLLPAKAK